jgi:hypothetical protein
MKDWKMRVFILNTVLNSLYLWFIVVWLKYLHILTIPTVDINFLPGNILNSVVFSIINFASPIILLNYFLIFHKNRYKKIILQYKDKKLNLALPYTLISAALYGITVVVYAIFWS